MAEASSSSSAPHGATKNSERLDAASIAKTMQSLGTSADGLTSAQAGERLTRDGPNAIVAKEESRWKKLFGYFWGPIPWMIEIAAVISLFRADWPDFIVITGLLIYNAAVGFWQDNKAANALAALKQGLALSAHVKRDQKWIQAQATTLVAGDVITVAAGEILPADVLFIDGAYLSVDQAALTGESLPVAKAVGDTGYSGSIARQGNMTGVVTATGNRTLFGKTAKLVASAGAKSHAELAVLRIGDFLILLAAILAVILVGTQVYRDFVTEGAWRWSEAGSIAQFVLVLLIASVPVAMPAVMSVTMALGALALSKQKAIVSRLSAIEELAGVDVLCSDKTGTLTQNLLTLQEAIPFDSQIQADDVIFGAACATQSQSLDAIDQAVFKALRSTDTLKTWTQTDFTPFDPVNKKTIGVMKDPSGKLVSFAKGAPQVIAGLCKIEENAQDAGSKAYFGKVSQLASQGTRALGVAKSDDGGKTWSLLGLLALLDPPRPDAKNTIAQAHNLGLSVKMVTGDDVAIGAQISAQLGLGAHLLVASDVFSKDIDMNHIPTDAAKSVEIADGFGRVFPENKFEIVKALQERNHIVAMTGDGVNDAPALKQADCGIAVSGATDAARSAAALILTAPGLSTIINAIEEARAIFERITSYVYYRVAMTICIMFVVVLSYLVFDVKPLTAIMIVLLALLDDIPIMTIAYDRVKISPTPVRWNMHKIIIFSSFMGLLALIQSFGVVLGAMYWMNNAELMQKLPLTMAELQTMLFLQLAAGGHLLLFVVRTRSSVFSAPYPAPQLLLAIVCTQIIAVAICGFGIFVTALPWIVIGAIWAYVLVWMVITDLFKLLYFKIETERSTKSTSLSAPLQ